MGEEDRLLPRLRPRPCPGGAGAV